MYYSKIMQQEVLLQTKIIELKEKIKNLLKDWGDNEINLGILTEEEIDKTKRLYSIVIGKLNESFYGLNVGDTIDFFRKRNVSIPNSDIINLMDVNNLKYYKSMLNKCYKELSKSEYLNNDKIIAIAKNIGERANYYFIEQNGISPLESFAEYAFKTRDLKIKQKQEIKDRREEIKDLKALNKVLKSENKELKKEVKTLQRERKL